MSVPISSSSEPTSAYPPRFWWLKRISIAVALLLLALGGLRWEWERVAEGRTRAIVDAAHARGEPILPQEFAPATIPDSENAAVTLQHAASSIVTDADSDWMDTKWTGELTPGAIARIDRIAAKNATSLRLARQARSQPRADWGLVIQSPVILKAPLTYFNPQRELARMQQWVALGDHSRGKDREALNRVLDLLRQADAIEQGPFVIVITGLSGDGFQGLTCNVIHQISPDLQVVDDSHNSAATPTAAERSQVRAVIASLLDETHLRTATGREWGGEQMMVLDAAAYMAQGHSELAPQPLAWLFKPMFILDGNRVAKTLSKAGHAAALADKPSAVAALPKRDDRDSTDLARTTRLVSGVLGSPLARILQTRFQTLTERRAAAIELAIRLYRVDHAGRWPGTLSELVPDYLPAVPADPMATGGRPFAYHPSATPPVIYSVGENGVDDGGTSLPGQRYRWALPDAVFPLLPKAPTTQPTSTETQDDQ